MYFLFKTPAIVLLVFLSLTSEIIFAQNYEAIKTDAEYFFLDSVSLNIIAIRIDSVKTLNNEINYYNFNLKTGKLITENDLFLKNTVSKLTELIKLRIIEQCNEDKGIKPIKNLEKTDFWIDAIKPNGNFYITDESLNYVFNPYEIGPYYLGITEVQIPYERMKNILKPNATINYLIKKEKIPNSK